MLSKQVNNTIIVRLDRGEEILASLKKVCEEYRVRAASVVGIGAVEGTMIGVYDMQAGQYCDTELPQFMELTNLTGNVSTMQGERYLHLHVTLADTSAHAMGGHLKKAIIGATAEIFITVYDTVIDRVRDDATGLNLFSL